MMMPSEPWTQLANPHLVAAVLQTATADSGIMEMQVPAVLVVPVVTAMAGAIGVLWRANENQRRWLQRYIERSFDEEIRRAAHH